MSDWDWNSGEGFPWRAICESAAAPIGVFDLQGRLLYVNEAVSQLSGYARNEILENDPQELFQVTPSTQAIFDHILAAPESEFAEELHFLRADGRAVWVLVSGSLIRGHADAPMAIILHAQDITVRKEVELRWRQTFDLAPIGMAQLDLRGHWQEVNAALCILLGYSRGELINRHYGEIAYSSDDEVALVADVLSGEVDTGTVENRYRHKAGYPIWVLVRISAVPDPENRPAYLIAQYEELGDRRMADDHLAHLALHDPLTGLANRALLFDRMRHQLAELSSSGEVFVVLLADFDEFKSINDTYGHLVGDQFLTAAADKLLTAMRPSDTAARYGGDEFVIIGRVDSLLAAENFRVRIEETLRIFVDYEAREVHLQASVGLAAATEQDVTAEALLYEADRDMYQRKIIRKNSPNSSIHR